MYLKLTWIVLLSFSLSAIATVQTFDLSGGGSEVLENGYISAGVEDGDLVSLRFDATGSSNYGMETISSPGQIRGARNLELSGKQLTLDHNGTIIWELPFVKAGYYDADTHLNYPNDRDTIGATELTLPDGLRLMISQRKTHQVVVKF